ncbi:MAG: LysR family transcriptional regulator [Thermogemmatispora sp.]|uniref:helix-turn-helix domain-containing protein n=1 Tax=Thermogemmatispora sp. TaxID=1968838 RepID=UPI0019F3B15D|nr:LysR family transcriptional regulator [Thermogemmatispora sp.]MBE3565913.1 LysR family transcriptional regulator [Thermogemmatispora sp.]
MQPAVTQQLAALEATVGEPLFLRHRGKKELYNQIVQARSDRPCYAVECRANTFKNSS